jgi:hypothetical protein
MCDIHRDVLVCLRREIPFNQHLETFFAHRIIDELSRLTGNHNRPELHSTTRTRLPAILQR